MESKVATKENLINRILEVRLQDLADAENLE